MSRAAKVEQLAKAYDDLAGGLDTAAAAAARADKNLALLNDSLRAVGAEAMKGYAMPGTALDPGVKPGSYVPQNDAQRAYGEQVIQEFQALAARIRSTTGADSFMAQEIDYTIGYIQQGRLSPFDAIRRLQAVLWNWQGGLFQEMSSPDRNLSQLASDLERFVTSGALNF